MIWYHLGPHAVKRAMQWLVPFLAQHRHNWQGGEEWDHLVCTVFLNAVLCRVVSGGDQTGEVYTVCVYSLSLLPAGGSCLTMHVCSTPPGCQPVCLHIC